MREAKEACALELLWPHAELDTAKRHEVMVDLYRGLSGDDAPHEPPPRAAAAEPSVIALRDQDLKFIATEETYTTDELIARNAINDEHIEYLKGTGLLELGAGRIGAMDEAGVNIQVLSAHTPGVQNVPGQEGIDFAYRLNKMIAAGPMATYPKRYQAYATLPLQDPEASADELERAREPRLSVRDVARG